MQYTEKQINEYVQAYICSNSGAIKDRLRFLLELRWQPEVLEKNRHLLAYNSRFLILPWVNVPHLASHLLGKCARGISKDWQTLYRHPVYWLETFRECACVPSALYLHAP